MNAERELAESRRLAHFLATGEVLPGYTSMCRVELQSPRIRREASAVLNPLLAPRSVPSRLSR
jgi:hypothetical protein